MMHNGPITAFDLSRVPEQWRDFMVQSLRAWKSESFSVRRPLGGKSGAAIMLVDIKTPRHEGQGILKLSDGEPLGDEQQRQEQARAVSPDLARRIPVVMYANADGPHSALLMSVAGRSLLETEVMANAGGGRLNLASQKISTSLLKEWNRSPSFAHGVVRADALLVEWLQHRIGSGSRIPDVLSKLIRLPLDCDTFRYKGIDYPNPHGFSTPGFPGSAIELMPGQGSVHGDLHAENVLISGPYIEDYYFIDFSFFRVDAPMFFDHAYLELHLLFLQRETATHERWHRLCRSLVGLYDTRTVENKLLDQDDHGLLWTVGMIRAAIFGWINQKFPNRLEDLKKQVLLARIAAGLNFANKRSLAGDDALSNKKKVFSFLYAATAAKELFDYCKLPVKDDGPIARPENEIPSPSGNAWRDVWDTCGGFNATAGAYVLLAGPDVGQLPDVSRVQLGRLPWSLVIDFDRRGTTGALALSASTTLKLKRGLHQILPHQTATADFATGTCWLFADAAPPANEGPPLPLVPWRRRTLPKLHNIASNLLKATTPLPTYLVVLGGSADQKRLEYTIATLEDEITGTLEIVVVSQTDGETGCAELVQEREKACNIVCDWQDLALGVHQMLGDVSDERGIWIPVRDPESKSVRREKVEPTDVALYAETIDIVPAGPAAYPQDTPGEDIADFLRGNTITWRELDLHLDVDRDVTKGPNGVLQRVRTLLAASPTESFAIEHTPGAGGTTIARRVAWELRDEYPCLIFKSLTENTSDVLEAIFQRSNLPLFIVAEAGRLPGTQRDSFFRALKGRSIRFVILDVRRRHTPRNTAASVAVVDPMASADTQRFLLRYEPKAPNDRRETLRNLASKSEFLPYRSPFFFGLYTFERDFIRIPDFVRHLLEALPARALRVVTQLALIRRYSQEALPAAALRLMLGLPSRPDNRSINTMLGGALSKIVMFDGRNVWVAHPLLAEEILRQRLQPSETDLPEAWRANLGPFCIQFIEEMAVEGLRESQAVKDILSDLYIERGVRQDSTAPQQFSNLLNDLRSRESQRRVLETLCEHFPDEAHFWNHLGRHMSICGSGTFEDAEFNLQKAIEIEPRNDVHRHALGMIYRKEVRRLLQDPLYGTETVVGRLAAVRPMFTQAEDCFEKAREFNRDNAYPIVTPIQMILETFERLAALAGHGGRYEKFLGSPDSVAEWCRDKIVTAQDLLSVLHHQEANSDPSPYRVECDSRLEGVLGNFEGMVQGFTDLLRRPDVARVPVRRMLANAYLRRIDSGTAPVQSKTLRRIVDLMEENLADNPSNGHDVRIWFRAYRMLPDFTLVRALEQMTQWSLISDDIDAKYYLYILHFIAARDGMPLSAREARQYIEHCRRHAPVLQSKKSFEWWSASTLQRPCPLVHHSELGRWSKERDFFEGIDKLGIIEGRIDDIDSPQLGVIEISGIPAFFAPRTNFYRARDLNAPVTCNLGFSYEGLRAWNVRRVPT